MPFEGTNYQFDKLYESNLGGIAQSFDHINLYQIGELSCLNGLAYEGYEIHMGRSRAARSAVTGGGNVYGSYIHGIFDAPGVADAVLGALCRKKGLSPDILGSFDPAAYREEQYNKLAQVVREGLDMELVYRILDRKD